MGIPVHLVRSGAFIDKNDPMRWPEAPAPSNSTIKAVSKRERFEDIPKRDI
jgi:hypothetical protein